MYIADETGLVVLWFFLKKIKKTEPVGGKLCLQQYVQIFLKSTSFVFFVDCFFLSFFLEKMHVNWFVRRSSFTCPMQHWEGGRKKKFRATFAPDFPVFNNF